MNKEDTEYLPLNAFWEPMDEWLPKVSKTKHNVSGKWPIVSMAAAIDPEDIPLQREILRQHGVTTEYTPTGEPVFRDRAHRKAHCEAVGLYDRDGSYGDPSPNNR